MLWLVLHSNWLVLNSNRKNALHTLCTRPSPAPDCNCSNLLHMFGVAAASTLYKYAHPVSMMQVIESTRAHQVPRLGTSSGKAT